jgi:hypothetical protein
MDGNDDSRPITTNGSSQRFIPFEKPPRRGGFSLLIQKSLCMARVFAFAAKFFSAPCCMNKNAYRTTPTNPLTKESTLSPPKLVTKDTV